MMNKAQFETLATPKALLYCRVSTTKQTIEGSGLQSQEIRCRQYAQSKGYHIEAVFPDDASGGGDYMTRPGMVALLSFLDANPDEDFVVIFDDLKRFARDTAFHLKLRDALAARGASVECLNFKFEDTAEGKFVETIFAAQGELEREQNRRQVIQKMKARIQAGYYCRTQPVGYKFKKVPEHGNMLVIDEPNASIVREAFEGFVSDRFETVADVARFLKGNPTISQATNRQRATEILQRSLYAGFITIPGWGFHMHPGKHEPLISLELWQAAQDKMHGKRNRPARVDVNESFPLRNYVSCECCHRPMTAGWSKGNKGKLYGYFTCQTKDCDRRGKSIRKEKIEAAFEELARSLTPRPVLFDLISDMFRHAWDQRLEQMKSAQRHLSGQLAAIDQKRTKLMKRLVAATSDDIANAYEIEVGNLTKEKRLLEERSTVALEPQKPFDECFNAAMNFFAKPWKLWESDCFVHKRLMLKLVLPEPIIYTREKGFLNPNFSLPFKLLGDPNMQNMKMVRSRRLELPPVLPDSDLNAARLPIPPRPHLKLRGF